jgi:hypothetical protein
MLVGIGGVVGYYDLFKWVFNVVYLIYFSPLCIEIKKVDEVV